MIYYLLVLEIYIINYEKTDGKCNIKISPIGAIINRENNKKIIVMKQHQLYIHTIRGKSIVHVFLVQETMKRIHSKLTEQISTQ